MTTTATPSIHRTRSSKARLYPAGLFAILILATALRIPHLGHDSFWYDEILSVLIARMSIPDLIKHVIMWEQIPPLHHLLLHAWIRIFGDSETSVRMPSVIAGVASVWMTYILIARLLGRRIALASALFLAVASMNIEYSRECRAYSLAVFLALWSCERFVTLLRHPTQRKQMWYIFATTLLLYTHVYGVFTIAAQGLYYLWRLWKLRRRMPLTLKSWLIAQIALVALYSPWIPIVIGWTRSIQINFWVKQASFDDIASTLWTFSGSIALMIILIALMTLGIARRRRRAGTWFLLALMLAPVLIPVTISVLTRPSFAPRYAIAASVLMYPLAAAGLMAIRTPALRLLLLAIIAVMSPFGDAARIHRPQWRQVGEYLNQNMRPGDLAVLNLRAATRFYDYYVNRPDARRVGIDSDSLPVTPPMDGRRIWLIAQEPRYPLPRILRRGPWRIERRFYTSDVLVLELTDEPEPATQASPSPSAASRSRSPSP